MSSASGAAICEGDHCSLPSVSGTASSLPIKTEANSAASSSSTRPLNIRIWSDLICPFCYLGDRRLHRALDRLDLNGVKLNIEWLPFQLDPTLPEKAISKKDRYRAKFGPQIDRMIANMTDMGRREGIAFSFGGLIGSTVDGHRLVEWSKKFGLHRELMQKIFQAYFEQEQNIADRDVLVKLAGDAGLNANEARKMLENKDEGRAEVTKFFEEAHRKEIHGVPHFELNGVEISGAQDPDTFVRVLERLGFQSKKQ
jgi:predicted DsbA family dithiol-disulfide isomerase